MKRTEFDADEILMDFLSDYTDNTLNKAEREAFEEYLLSNKEERIFAEKTMAGKKALAKMAKLLNPQSNVFNIVKAG